MTALRSGIDAVAADSSGDRRQPRRHQAARARRSRPKPGLRVRRHARRLHGGAQHPDRQRVAGRHPGAIGAGIDDGGWISTSYLIAEIIVIP